MSIIKNLKQVQQQINQAARRAGRDPKAVKLVVAGKYADVDLTRQVIKAGAAIIGENKEQDLKRKYLSLGNLADWHFIGHLQRNKVKSVIKMVSLIHSVDSIRLVREINKQAQEINKQQQILIEVNVSGESSQFGVLVKELLPLAVACRRLANVKLIGLMTMSSGRPYFIQLKNLAAKLKLKHLSMGTTQDFATAIEAGATFVRVGSAIFS